MEPRREKKCGRPTCKRKAQNGGLCRHHYRLAMEGKPTGLVDSTKSREHIARLRELGIGTPRIAELAGVPQVTIWRITQSTQVLAATEMRVMAIAIPRDPYLIAKAGACMPLVGAQRRLQALMANGHTGMDLAGYLGVNKRAVVAICAGHQQYVTADLARRIDSMFRELQLQQGGSSITRGRALVKGWHPPLAWDEDTIDDPNALPAEVERAEGTDWWPSYLELKDMGVSDEIAADRLGVKLKSLRARRDRLTKRAA